MTDKQLSNEQLDEINKALDFAQQTLLDCRSEIQRLLTANETLKGLCDEYQAQIKAQEYVPMTDDEADDVDFNKEDLCHIDIARAVESEVIKRAGLRVKEKE